MKHGSLFSGGGGFDYAAQLIGWENIFHCEWNPFCKELLKHYWPNAHSYTDVRKFDGTQFRGQIDIITGGFPCQPFSQAGKRRGTSDDRYLWPEMLRIISEIRPRWVVGENVQGILNWNGGLVFEQVHIDLEAQGYEVQAFLLPAAGINAPHRRYRVWFVAYAPDRRQPQQIIRTDTKRNEEDLYNRQNFFTEPAGSMRPPSPAGPGRDGAGSTGRWATWPTEYPLCRGNDGLSERLDGTTFLKWRKETIRVFGNAIVPEIAYEIFKAIEYTEGPHNAPR